MQQKESLWVMVLPTLHDGTLPFSNEKSRQERKKERKKDTQPPSSC